MRNIPTVSRATADKDIIGSFVGQYDYDSDIISLSGGASGAHVYRAWSPEFGSIVIKTDELDNIDSEIKARDEMYKDIEVLRERTLAGRATPIEVCERGVTMWVSGMALLWNGPQTQDDSIYNIREFIRRPQFAASRRGVFRNVLNNINAGERIGDFPPPITTCLRGRGGREIYWDGVEKVLSFVNALTIAEINPLQNLQEEYKKLLIRHGNVGDVDWRQIHGDTWFNNVIAETTNNSVCIIDFGNSRTGHIYSDLARFEIDLWLTLPEGETVERRLAQIDSLCQTFVPRDSGLFAVDDPNFVWREEVERIRGQVASVHNFESYRIFLLNDAIRRLTWPAQNLGPSEDVAILLLEIVHSLALSLGLELYSSGSTVRLPSHPFRATHYLNKVLGLGDVYPRSVTFRENEIRDDAMGRVLENATEGRTVRIVGGTAHSFLADNSAQSFRVKDLLSRGVNIEVVVASYVSLPYYQHGNKTASGIDNLKDLAEQVRQGVAHIRNLNYSGQIELRECDFVLPARVIYGVEALFFEPYLPGSSPLPKSSAVRGLSLEVVTADSDLWKALQDYWSFLWSISRPCYGRN